MSGILPQPLLNVLATGSTTPRLLSDRFSDVINVLDWGVVHDPGAAHVLANTTACQNALNAAAGRAVILPAGVTITHTQLVITVSLELQINGTMILAPTIAGQAIGSSIVINASNVTVRLGATGIVDGNKANQLGTLYGTHGAGGGIITAQNPGAIDSPLPTQGVTRFSDIHVYGPGTVQNTWTWPVSINNTLRCKVMGVRMLNSSIDFAGYVKSPDGVEGPRPDELLAVLWGAVRELSAQVTALQAAMPKPRPPPKPKAPVKPVLHA